MELHWLDIAVFAVFVIAVLAIGILKSRGEKDSESYFLAGRGLTWWLIGFSLIAANISAEQFIGMSGAAAKDSIGLAVASYEWCAAITLVVVAFFFLPKFLRSGIFTIPEYLEYRYNHSARTIMSLLMVIIYVAVTIATVVYAGAKAVEPLFSGSVLGIPINLTSLCWVIGILAAVYVAAGGLKACAWADLIQGSALILGGAVIMVLTFMALDNPGDFREIDEAAVHASLGVEEDATFGEKFQKLKEAKMHMVLPADNTFLPWTALLLGIWIPNFYYWGLNQFIMQRTLGAASLAQGQKGVVFAAALKLVIPFIVCIPGIMALNLYGPKMQESAMQGDQMNKPVLAAFESARAKPDTAKKVFPFDKDFAVLETEMAQDILAFNAAVAGVAIPADAELAEMRQHFIASFNNDKHPNFQQKVKDIKKANEELDEGKEKKTLGLNDLNSHLVAMAAKDSKIEKQQELVGYDYDSAFAMLIRYLTPVGLKGFVLAALMGAVVSSLASMLNAASTIFTLDIYNEYINKNASQNHQVWVGRVCVLIFVLIGCAIAPQLASPKFKGAFEYIQEFQGYVSPGILTIFMFGLFVPRTPRICGVVGLALSPIIYGVLMIFWGDMPFLNRMAITVGLLMVVLAVMTVISPLREPLKLPEQDKIEMKSSKGALAFGLLVCIATLALYAIFW